MHQMTISPENLEQLLTTSKDFISTKDNKPFTDFKSSKYIDTAENYKYSVYEEARETSDKNGGNPKILVAEKYKMR